MREQANRSITFKEVQADPDRYAGDVVIWGGSIIETFNRQEGTYITVLQSPLSRWEEPRESVTSQGRFLLKHPSYLDPEIYKKGRKLSVAGKIIGKEIRKIGKISYVYPLLLAEELHLWKEQRPEPWDYYYQDRFYWDYWDPYYFRPRLLFHRHRGYY